MTVPRHCTCLSLPVLVTLLVCLLIPCEGLAANTATATKSRNTDGTYDTTNTGYFAIGSGGQTVHWEASYQGSATEGDDFYLHTSPTDQPGLALSTNLSSGPREGEAFLGAGNYEINISLGNMGPGTYTITYNRTASMAITPPTTHDFHSCLEGTSSSVHTFTIRNTGDFQLTLGAVTNTDGTHFPLTADPAGDVLDPGESTGLGARFVAGTAAGTTPEGHSATLTTPATAVGGATVTPVTATVSGTTTPRLPDISCCTSGEQFLGQADHTIGEVKSFTVCFKNVGNEDLLITSIQVLNDDPLAPFSAVPPPSTTSLDAGDTRNVTVRFAPPAAGGEREYTGRLRVDSNDPDEPVHECAFRARAHHPVPRMRVVETVLDYHEVELGFAFTKAVIIANDGDAPLTADLHLDPAFPATDQTQWASLDLRSLTVQPARQEVLRQVYAPQVMGTHTLRLEATGNDALTPRVAITLQGSGISPVPLDNVLMLDRSGSMQGTAGGRRKIDVLRTAADLYTHLLAQRNGGATSVGDKIAFVKYNHVNSVYLPLDVVTGAHLTTAEDALSSAAIGDVGRLAPDGFTGIGGAMETSAGLVASSGAERKHVMVLLTDGMQNRTPWVQDVLPGIEATDPLLHIYSVGLGSAHDPILLQEITNVMDGYHQVQDDLSGTSVFDLEAFYFKIFANAAGMSLVADPTTAVSLTSPHPQVVQTAAITTSDHSATFVVFEVEALRPYYTLELVDPHGRVILPGVDVGGVPVHVLERLNYRLVRVLFPDVMLADTYVGTWTLRLTANGRWKRGNEREVWAKEHWESTAWEPLNDGLAPIGFGAAVASDYRMDATLTADTFLPGAALTLSAALTDRNWPAPRGQVQATVTAPDGTPRPPVMLFDDATHGDAAAGDGVFTTRYTQTSQPGSYRVLFHAVGYNERGELAPREDTRYVTLARHTEPPGGGDQTPCIPCPILRWLWAVALLLLIALLLSVVRCCRRLRAKLTG